MVEAQAFATPLLIGSVDRAQAYRLSSIPDSRDELSKLRPKCIFVDGDTAELETTIGWIAATDVAGNTTIKSAALE